MRVHATTGGAALPRDCQRWSRPQRCKTRDDMIIGLLSYETTQKEVLRPPAELRSWTRPVSTRYRQEAYEAMTSMPARWGDPAADRWLSDAAGTGRLSLRCTRYRSCTPGPFSFPDFNGFETCSNAWEKCLSGLGVCTCRETAASAELGGRKESACRDCSVSSGLSVLSRGKFVGRDRGSVWAA